MRKIMILLLAAVCLVSMTGCICFHDWVEADCVNPKTCLSCEKTEGEPLGHSWQEATCEAPKTCATCGETEGEALGHDWQEATTEAPKTCSRCALTEGERIITDPRFTTDACKDLFGTWQGTFDIGADVLGMEGYTMDITCEVVFEFFNDGSAAVLCAPVDMEAFEKTMVEFTMNMVYDNFAASGMSREDTDEAMVSVYGMTMEEFVLAMLKEMNLEEAFRQPTEEVYYVENGTLYLSDSWDGVMEGSAFSLNGDTLIINDPLLDTDVMTLTRVK